MRIAPVVFFGRLHNSNLQKANSTKVTFGDYRDPRDVPDYELDDFEFAQKYSLNLGPDPRSPYFPHSGSGSSDSGDTVSEFIRNPIPS